MIVYTWDRRKAAPNLREHKVSFTLAEYALRTCPAIPVEEQFRGGEWRTKIVVLVDAVALITVLIGTGEDDEGAEPDERVEPKTATEDRVLRILSARESSSEESELFFAAYPQHWK